MKCSCGKKGCKGCRKGYAYGTKMISPMGYYNGSLYAAPEEEEKQEEPNVIGQGYRATSAPAPLQPSIGESLSSTFTPTVVNKGVEAVFADKAVEEGVNAVSAAQLAGADAATKAGVEGLTQSLAGEGVKIAGQEATKAAADAATSSLGGALGDAAVPGVSSLAMGLIDDGQIDSGEAAQAAGAAAGAALGSAILPGIGTFIGGALGGLTGGMLGGSDTPKAPPPMMGKKPVTPEQVAALDPSNTEYEEDVLAGYADGSKKVKSKTTDPIQDMSPRQQVTATNPSQNGIDLKYLAEKGLFGIAPAVVSKGFADGTKGVSPEEYQKRLIMENLINPALAYVEEKPMLKAPLFLAGAGAQFARNKLPLGSFKGGKLEGGKDRIAYRHDTLGDIEYNPKDERVMYKKTIRF